MELQSPPTDQIYLSLSDLTTALNTFAGSQGYAVVKQRTKKNPKTDEVVKAYFRCDRGGKPEDKEHGRKRKHAATRLIDCPFSCFALDKKDVGWILVVRDSSHNHEATSEGFHPSLRKLAMNKEIMTSIDTQLKAQATPSQVMTSLRLQDDNCFLKKKDIYNVKQAIRLKNLGPLSPIQYLLRELERDNWYFQFRMQEISHEVTHLFFVEKHTVEILKGNSEVFLMDCTYKTNKFKLPLLVIIGHTSLGITFYVGFAFLAKEHEEDFVWVLTALKEYLVQTEVDAPEVLVTDRDMGLIAAIRTVFPDTAHLLCIWHVNKNVLAHCKPAFPTTEAWEAFYAAWHNVIQSKTRDALDIAWEKLKDDYYVGYDELIDYLDKTWIRIFAKKNCQMLHQQSSSLFHHYYLSVGRGTSSFETASRIFHRRSRFCG